MVRGCLPVVCGVSGRRGEGQAVAHASQVPAVTGFGAGSNPGARPPLPLQVAGTISWVNPLGWLDRLGADRTEKGQVLYILYVIIAVLVIIVLLKVLGVV